MIEGVLRWCRRHGLRPPRITGVELSPGRAAAARTRFEDEPAVDIVQADFLLGFDEAPFDYVIANPPYVSILGLDQKEKLAYRSHFRFAKGRFDLYFLFLEQSLRLLVRGGRLVFITPEKYLYVASARALRMELWNTDVEEIVLLNENTFPGLTTYPCVTVINNKLSERPTRCLTRDQSTVQLHWVPAGHSLLPQMNGGQPRAAAYHQTLGGICERISAGVATGADSVFVQPRSDLPSQLRPFAFPTLSGRQLASVSAAASPNQVMLVPYDRSGQLLPEADLGAMAGFLSNPAVRERLMKRTCVQRKPWYAFHETPPMKALLQPKLLCKDIAREPRFWVDPEGVVVPRHSVYYIVPKRPELLAPLAEYMASDDASRWLQANCQRAANGFIRLQSTVLKKLPVPDWLAEAAQAQTSMFADDGGITGRGEIWSLASWLARSPAALAG